MTATSPCGIVPTVTSKTMAEDHPGTTLRAARAHARLSVEQLARRLSRAPSVVEAAERGLAQVRPSYVDDVLDACGLPKGWRAPR